MIKRLTPAAVHPPLARYAHATEVPPGARWLVLSGQLGIAADGSVPPDVEGQATICFQNIIAILREAGMDVSDLVRLTTYANAEDRHGYERLGPSLDCAASAFRCICFPHSRRRYF